METFKEFDSSMLDELKEYKDEHNRDLRFSLVETYIKETNRLIDALKISSTDKTFSEISHSLKSSTASMGGMKLSNLFATLEHGTFSPFEKAKHIKEVEQMFSNLQKNLQIYLKTAA